MLAFFKLEELDKIYFFFRLIRVIRGKKLSQVIYVI